MKRVWMLVAAVVALALVIVWLGPKPAPIPPREQKTADSLDATKPHYDTVRIERVRTETLFVAKSANEAQRAATAEHVADSLHSVVSAIQRTAEAQGDTSREWKHVATVERVENDSLRSANGALTQSLADQTTARITASARATAAEQRLTATQSLADRLAADLKHGDCHIAFVLNCPSRRATAVISLAGGIVGGVLLDRRFGR